MRRPSRGRCGSAPISDAQLLQQPHNPISAAPIRIGISQCGAQNHSMAGCHSCGKLPLMAG